MSKLAKQLAVAPPSAAPPVRHGPANICGPLYGPDVEDQAAIDEFRHRPNESWRTAQAKWDDLLGIDPARRIPNDKFRYHWRRGCGCWPDGLRQR